jgi:hypothetical protein
LQPNATSFSRENPFKILKDYSTANDVVLLWWCEEMCVCKLELSLFLNSENAPIGCPLSAAEEPMPRPPGSKNRKAGIGSLLPVSTSAFCKKCSDDDEVTIERLPLFDFLSIPDPLKRQFKLPAGCVISAEFVLATSPSLLIGFRGMALRKVKTLGLRKNFRVIRPGDLGCLPPRSVLLMDEAPPPPTEEEEPEETSEYPPFEPLVLWSHSEDSSKKIEVCSTA